MFPEFKWFLRFMSLLMFIICLYGTWVIGNETNNNINMNAIEEVKLVSVGTRDFTDAEGVAIDNYYGNYTIEGNTIPVDSFYSNESDVPTKICIRYDKNNPYLNTTDLNVDYYILEWIRISLSWVLFGIMARLCLVHNDE